MADSDVEAGEKEDEEADADAAEAAGRAVDGGVAGDRQAGGRGEGPQAWEKGELGLWPKLAWAEGGRAALDATTAEPISILRVRKQRIIYIIFVGRESRC